MRSRKTQAIPARLEAGRRRFERWRRTRQGHSRIPEPLWTSAIKLAGAYGLCRTARTLGLDYNALKRRVGSAGLHDSPAGPTPRRKMPARSASSVKKSAQNQAMSFVELVPPEDAYSPECIVELEDPRGARMRIHLKGSGSPDLAALSRSFWGLES